MIGDLVNRGTTTNRFFSCLATQEHFYMYHIMLDYRFWVEVLGAVEYKVSGLHFFKLKIDGQSVILITLIPVAHSETKIFL